MKQSKSKLKLIEWNEINGNLCCLCFVEWTERRTNWMKWRRQAKGKDQQSPRSWSERGWLISCGECGSSSLLFLFNWAAGLVSFLSKRRQANQSNSSFLWLIKERNEELIGWLKKEMKAALQQTNWLVMAGGPALCRERTPLQSTLLISASSLLPILPLLKRREDLNGNVLLINGRWNGRESWMNWLGPQHITIHSGIWRVKLFNGGSSQSINQLSFHSSKTKRNKFLLNCFHFIQLVWLKWKEWKSIITVQLLEQENKTNVKKWWNWWNQFQHWTFGLVSCGNN